MLASASPGLPADPMADRKAEVVMLSAQMNVLSVRLLKLLFSELDAASNAQREPEPDYRP